MQNCQSIHFFANFLKTDKNTQRTEVGSKRYFSITLEKKKKMAMAANSVCAIVGNRWQRSLVIVGKRALKWLLK